MTVSAKTLVKDKFWIVEQNGQKLGTLQKQENNGWIFLSKQDKNQRQVFHTQESLFSKFGFGIFEESNVVRPDEEIQTDNFDVHGYPCSQHPYNPMFDVQKQLPVYTKTPKSKKSIANHRRSRFPVGRHSPVIFLRFWAFSCVLPVQ